MTSAGWLHQITSLHVHSVRPRADSRAVLLHREPERQQALLPGRASRTGARSSLLLLLHLLGGLRLRRRAAVKETARGRRLGERPG